MASAFMGDASRNAESTAIRAAVTPRSSWNRQRGLIPRRRVIERLRGRTQFPILLLRAPAGYGKSTVLAEWEAEDSRAFAWLTLDGRHDDASLLAGSIATVLDVVEPVGAPVFDALAGGLEGPSPVVTTRLAESVAKRQTAFVLVLDDLHTVSNPDSLELISALAERLPPGSQLALAARWEPALPLGRLRGRGLLTELGARDLAMSAAEASDLLHDAGIEIGGESARSLVEHTEGWPVAIYLAGRALEDAEDAGAAIAGFEGDDRLIADYVRDELFATLPENDFEFLTGCAALEQLDGPLCDAALDRQGSADDLRRLSRANLLIIPLDRSDREYRYHHLLREMLQAELARRGDTAATAIHSRASAWYAARGDFDRAIPHAIASRDLQSAGALVFLSTATYVSHGRTATLRRFLDEFSEAEMIDSPSLALAQAGYCLTLAEGAEVDRWTSIALAAITNAPAAERSLLEASASLIRAAGASSGPLSRMQQAAAAARPLLPEGNPWLTIACLIEGVAEHLGESEGSARAILEEGVSRGTVAAPTVSTLCLAQLALLELEQGNETRAWAHEERAVAAVERFGLDHLTTESLVLAVSALIRARRGRVDEAAIAARKAAALIAVSPGTSSWFEAESRIVLARALLLLDDCAAARVQLSDAERHLDAVSQAPGLRRMFETTDAEAKALATDGGRWPLTPAELRLLHLLPTHHSFKEIGEQLFVSANTVKSQARSIYRKFGVGSRAEAVECARAGGLLDDSARSAIADRSRRPSAP